MSGLAEYLRDWSPRPVERSDRVTSWAVDAFAALLDQPSPLAGGRAELPPLWHWFGFLDHPAQSELGADGHPADGRFLPPIPHRRRMFAGGRWYQRRPLPVERPVSCRSAVASVEVKTGRSGEMAFVTVRNEFVVDGADGEPSVTEEQDIVYRSQPDPPPGAAPASRAPAAPAGTEQQQPPEHELELTPDPALLFRFSALTYNGHRIHYDQPYVTGVEGYPGLVVHGPLLALLALELPRRHRPDRRVTEFRYRLRRPAFAGQTLRARSVGDELEVGVPGAPASLTASVRLTEEG
ncbi:MaoC family dehydratase N-terminal domain-containing protein [Pseudonocardia acaciae]|uniref:MaoC family dehydratase N-terminal domain-containing protein n=1 Tax=Pseudonocardia acaciae TaxID=551276 RepID=UPI000565C737|nr:MaoC family dehydratase N-terminal domain-containing protein [Pseudonocardia acaciae]